MGDPLETERERIGEKGKVKGKKWRKLRDLEKFIVISPELSKSDFRNCRR